ncbi:hypothetical protein ACUXHY_005012, partial [Cytobacillus horneckiae]
ASCIISCFLELTLTFFVRSVFKDQSRRFRSDFINISY